MRLGIPAISEYYNCYQNSIEISNFILHKILGHSVCPILRGISSIVMLTQSMEEFFILSKNVLSFTKM